MDRATAQKLNDLNKAFYDAQADAFSATRNNSWRGWEIALEAAGLLRGETESGVMTGARSGNVPIPVGLGDAAVFGEGSSRGDCEADTEDGVDALSGNAEASSSQCETSTSDRGVEESLGDGDKSEDGVMAGVEASSDILRVLDVACGNMRFETWLKMVAPGWDCRFVAIDACVGLLPDEVMDDVRFEECDIVTSLLEGDAARAISPEARFDLVVSFGFMHHAPGLEARIVLLDALLGATRPGGHVIVSFWRFADDEGLASRAEKSTADALKRAELAGLELDEGDYLLGFGSPSSELRYCHSFSDRDIDAVLSVVKVPFELIARYRADGRTSALNEYVVLKRR